VGAAVAAAGQAAQMQTRQMHVMIWSGHICSDMRWPSGWPSSLLVTRACGCLLSSSSPRVDITLDRMQARFTLH
jgi:hypothetical protein